MRPRSIIRFERALLIALAIDLIYNLASRSMMAARLVASGIEPAAWLLLLACIGSPIVGLILWFAIARRASVVAKWIMVALVTAGVIGFLWALAANPASIARPMMIVAVLSELLKAFAVSCLLRRDAVRWLGGWRST